MFTPGEKVGSFVVVARLWTRPGSITFLAKRESDESAAAYVVVESLDRAANDDPKRRDSLLERARLLATVRTPTVPAVIEMGEARGVAWVAREFRDGISLPQLLTALANRRRKLSPGAASAIVLRVARALAAVTEATSLSHGGVETDRILVGFDGSVSLIGWMTAMTSSPAADTRALGARLLETASSRRAGDTFFAVPGDAATQHLVDVARDAFEGRTHDTKSFATALAANAPLAEGIEQSDLAALVADLIDPAIERARVVLPADVARVFGALRPAKGDFDLDELTAALPEDVSVEFAAAPHPRRASVPPKPIAVPKAPVRVGGAVVTGSRPVPVTAAGTPAANDSGVIASSSPNTAATRPHAAAPVPRQTAPVPDEDDEVTRIAPLPKAPSNPSLDAVPTGPKSPAEFGLGKQAPVGLGAKPIPGASTSAKAPLSASNTSARAAVAATPAKASVPNPAAPPRPAAVAAKPIATPAAPPAAVAVPIATSPTPAAAPSAVGAPVQGPGLAAKPAGAPKRTMMMSGAAAGAPKPVPPPAIKPTAAAAPVAVSTPASVPTVTNAAASPPQQAVATSSPTPNAFDDEQPTTRLSSPPPMIPTALPSASPSSAGSERAPSIPPPVPPEAARISSPGAVAAPAVASSSGFQIAPPPAEGTPSIIPPPPAALVQAPSFASQLGGPAPSPFGVPNSPTPFSAEAIVPSAAAAAYPGHVPANALAATMPMQVTPAPQPVADHGPDAFAPTTAPEPPRGSSGSRGGYGAAIGAFLGVAVAGTAFAYWFTHRAPEVVAQPPAIVAPVPVGTTPPAQVAVVAAVDAGSDAGFDAGIDAGVDAGFDAGIDAGSDAGSDAGTVVVVAEPPPAEIPETPSRTTTRRTTSTRTPSMTTATMTTATMTTAPTMTTTSSSSTTMRRAGFLTDF